VQRLRGEEPAADGSAKPILDMRGLAYPGGRKRVAQTAELRDLQAHGVDRAPGDQLEHVAQGAGGLVGFHCQWHRAGDERQAFEVIRIDRLLAQINAMLGHTVDAAIASFGV